MPETYYVYILASTFQKLYTGVTNNLPLRIHQHKNDKNPKGHTARYKINKLVHYERFEYIQNAIAREKQIKGWLRIKKLQLIATNNPTWRDLSLDWGQPIEPFNEANLRHPKPSDTPTAQTILTLNNACHFEYPLTLVILNTH